MCGPFPEAAFAASRAEGKENEKRSTITCPVCFRHCVLTEGGIGNCLARANQDGRSVTLNYGMLTSLALDPIEKKPLVRFCPGSYILSAGSYGCNLHCTYCQNWEISQERAKAQYVSPEELTKIAEEQKTRGNIGVAFTYNEPMIGYEYIRDTARLVQAAGMKTVVVTNGSVTAEILREVLPYIDAMNIDLKGFSEEFYRRVQGNLGTVLDFIRIAAEACHVELTCLIIPGENDDPEEMRALSSFVASIRPDIPLHITRFFPRYQMRDRSPTDVGTIYSLAEIAREKLKYVYEGNV